MGYERARLPTDIRALLISSIIVIVSFALSASLNVECRCEGLEIVVWNAQNLGPTKLADGRAERIAATVEHADVIIIQEITDASGATGRWLCARLSRPCVVSERTGTNRKEQYLVASHLPIVASQLREHPDLERGVFTVRIAYGSEELTLATHHVKPDRARDEIEILEALLDDAILIGDLNADCSYLPSGTSGFVKHRWIVPDHEDTTASGSDCAYDRVLVPDGLLGHVRGYRVHTTPVELSDHYPVSLVVR